VEKTTQTVRILALKSEEKSEITVNADVSAEKVLERVNEILKDKIKDKKIEIFFTSKNGGTNVFTAIIHLEKIDDLRELIDLVNSSFDKAYWSAKSS